jgi:hypothetical protein
MSHRAGATVTVTVEISNLGAWGSDCQLDQVYKQAAESAIGKLRTGMREQDFRIVGNPQVRAVIVDQDSK